MKSIVTNVKVTKNWISETSKSPVVVTALVNKVPVRFPFTAAASGDWTFLGIDCNNAVVVEHRCTVAKPNTGSRKCYALCIGADVIKQYPKENQKDFRFTGRYYSTKGIPAVFKRQLQQMIENNEVTDDFLISVGLK